MVDKGKRNFRITKSFKDIISKNYKVKLLIIGDGQYRTEIKTLLLKII